jgi:hypothetical protein
MFFLQLWLDLLFYVSVHALIPMKKTSLFFVHHWFTWKSTTIDNSNYVPIGLNVVSPESFEVWIGNTIIHHDLV